MKQPLNAYGIPIDSKTGKCDIQGFEPSTSTVTIKPREAKAEGKAAILPAKSKKKLKNLQDWNDNRRTIISTTPEPNGFACPLCGSELADSRPGECFSNFSGTFVMVECPGCDYTDRRRV